MKIIRLFLMLILWMWDRILTKFGFSRPNIVVLMYHSISETEWPFSIGKNRFEQQLKYLNENGYQFISVHDVVEVISGRQELLKKSVLITFDDGYQDFFDSALPILEHYGAPSIVFVHSDRSSTELGNTFSLMDWDTITRITNQGVTVGNHSDSHPNLKRLSSQQLVAEFDTSESFFFEKLGTKPKFFAYPGGKLNAGVVDELTRREYLLAFTVDEGLVYPNQDKMRIPRIGITRNMSFLEFKIKLTRVADWYAKVRNLWR